jgi:hypothetical protein
VLERWKWCKGYRGLYRVSTFGRVKSKRRPGTKGKILSTARDNDGYVIVRLSKNGKVKHKKVHVLVLEAFVGPRPIQKQSCHFPDRDKENNRLSNLSWGTSKRNNSHKKHHGTSNHGSRNGNAVLTERAVYVILKRLKAGHSGASIGRAFGVGSGLITYIKQRKIWKHVRIT